jgi:hypothetical protein
LDVPVLSFGVRVVLNVERVSHGGLGESPVFLRDLFISRGVKVDVDEEVSSK